MAEAIFNKLTNGEQSVSSAGTDVIKGDDTSRVGKKLGETSGAENVLAVLKEIGIDASGRIRTPIAQELVDNADQIIVMAERNVSDYLKQSPKTIFWKVDDPFGQSLEFTRDTRNQIEGLIRRTFSAYMQKF